MKKDPAFLGIYIRKDPAGKESPWNVWNLEDGSFLVQRLSDNGEENEIPATVDRVVFFHEFRVRKAFDAAGRSGGSGKSPPASASRPKFFGTSIFDEEAADDIYPVMHAAVDVYEEDLKGLLYPTAPPDSSVPSDPSAWKKVEKTPRPQKKNNPVPGGSRRLFDAARNKAATDARDAEEKKKDPFHFVVKEKDLEEKPEEDLTRVEKQLRSDFSIALIRLQNNRDMALESLNKILEHHANFRKEHKHMFSDFGTALRRRRLYSLAGRFHDKAKELAPDDEHILFNIARAMYEAGKINQAREYLREAVSMAGDFREGCDFLEFIERKFPSR
ncbi:MAG: tetratricopeptide repeat protein [Deltaproteobacteria bacterium]|nr:tetratricopeptide repeat protein [Deltaproteobacteria bacterium]